MTYQIELRYEPEYLTDTEEPASALEIVEYIFEYDYKPDTFAALPGQIDIDVIIRTESEDAMEYLLRGYCADSDDDTDGFEDYLWGYVKQV